MKRKILAILICMLLIATVASFSSTAKKCERKPTTHIVKLNLPPDAPTVKAPTEVQRGKFFDVKVVTTDPEGDDVYYKFDINGHTFGWRGEFPSGVEHIEKNLKLVVPAGSYILGVQAKDIHEAKSEWTYVEIIVKTKSIGIEAINAQFFINFLENHPNMFPLLRLLLRL
jgi:hypothetical protein